MIPIISTGMWVSLSNEVRYRMRTIFNISQSGITEVNDGRVVSDGTTYEDLKALTIEKMQKYVDNPTTDFHKLIDLTVAKVMEELYPKVPKEEVRVSTDAGVNIIIDAPKKRGRPRKSNGTQK
jgi:hypothetical protein